MVIKTRVSYANHKGTKVQNTLLEYATTDTPTESVPIVRCPYCRIHKVQKIKGSIKMLCPSCVVSFEVKK